MQPPCSRLLQIKRLPQVHHILYQSSLYPAKQPRFLRHLKDYVPRVLEMYLLCRQRYRSLSSCLLLSRLFQCSHAAHFVFLALGLLGGARRVGLFERSLSPQYQ